MKSYSGGSDGLMPAGVSTSNKSSSTCSTQGRFRTSNTYQVVLLALGCVFWIPLLISVSLLEVVVATTIAVIVA